MCPRPHLSFCACKTAWLASESLVFMGPIPLICSFCMQKSDFRAWITSLYRFQTSPMFFCIQTATLAPELQVSMGPSLHLWFCAFTTATLASEILLSMGPSPHLWFCECKTTWLASESLVFMGPSPLICGFCMQNSNFRTRITSL